MSQSSNIVNKKHERGRNPSTSIDENIHSTINGTSLSLQSFVEDIPFEFNPKYRSIIVSNIDIPEYDTTQIRDILSKPVDFKLENKVLLEALEDLKRKKKKIEADNLHQQSSSPSANSKPSDSSSLSGNLLSGNYLPPSSHLHVSPTRDHIPVINKSIPLKTPPTPPSASSFHLLSVRDIYWPSNNHQEYNIPTNLPRSNSSNQSSSNSVKQTNHSFNNSNSINRNDLAATFDGTLTSDDPFHDAELKSLDDVAELNHLYSAVGSANTIRR